MQHLQCEYLHVRQDQYLFVCLHDVVVSAAACAASAESANTMLKSASVSASQYLLCITGDKGSCGTRASRSNCSRGTKGQHVHSAIVRTRPV